MWSHIQETPEIIMVTHIQYDSDYCDYICKIVSSKYWETLMWMVLTCKDPKLI